eukprot:5291912-Pyramimonas_sp.AAC.1
MRRVRLLNPELRTRSAARTKSETIRIVRVILRDAVGSLHLTRAVGGAAGLVITRFRDIRRVRLSHAEV